MPDDKLATARFLCAKLALNAIERLNGGRPIVGMIPNDLHPPEADVQYIAGYLTTLEQRWTRKWQDRVEQLESAMNLHDIPPWPAEGGVCMNPHCRTPYCRGCNDGPKED